ncbi:MAG: SDR family NAD(P)-dependent oxidoreductase, partial [Gemmatimonadetes bacterium]|nr:SDR family NAD(P)-dependent oxidoreductase [Gemmatimonadota bacterium]
MARGLATAAARVAVVGRNQERGDAVVGAIRAAEGEAIFVSCDATDRDALSAARDRIVTDLGE